MKHGGFFNNLGIKWKLVVSFLIFFIPAASVGSVMFYSVVKKSIQTNIESELNNTTESIVNMVRTAAKVSVKNRLRAIAEKNLEIMRSIWGRHLDGTLSREEAVERIRRLLLCQTVGKTGYIYCIDSSGTAVLHRNKGVEGASFIDRAFIKEQIRKKEGYIEYQWKNPGETKMRDKVLYMTYFQPLDMIVSVSAYRDQFGELIDVADFREGVLAIRFGKTGYSYVADTEGNVIIHPKVKKFNIFEEPGYESDFFREMLLKKNGKVVYSWRNPDEELTRKKLVLFNFLPEYRWIVASSYYFDEVNAPLVTVRNMIIVAVTFTFLLVLSIAFYICSSISGPIGVMIDRLKRGTGGDFKVRMEHRSNDELGRLSAYFNTFMEKLESYDTKLTTENRERRNVEKTLKESIEQYQGIFSSVMDALLVYTLDGTVVEANPSACALYGFDYEELIGRTREEIVHPSFHDRFETCDRVLAGEGEFHTEWREVSRWGAVMDVELSASTFLFKGQKHVLVDVRDITERKAAEEEIHRLAQFQETIIDNAGLWMSVHDRRGNIVTWNKAAETISGYARDEVVGRDKIWEWLYPRTDHRNDNLERILDLGESGGEATDYESAVRSRDGKNRFISWHSRTLVDKGGRFVGVLSIGRDTTETKKLQSRLRQSQKMEAIGTLAGGIAHDFNNILAVIIGQTELIQMVHAREDEKLGKRAEELAKAAYRARDLVAQILTFSRKGDRKRDLLLLGPVVKETVKFLRASIPSTVDIRMNLDNGGGKILADPIQMHQVIMNLSMNAAHAMGESGGILHIELSEARLEEKMTEFMDVVPPGRYMTLSVSDSGHGIGHELQEKIFDPYFTTKSRGQGSGLGLSVVHGIVKSHGGGINVYSEPGQGALFRVYLPCADKGAKEARNPAEKEIVGGSERILFVDDEEAIEKTGAEILTGLGYEVITAADGAEALALFKSRAGEIDLLVTDLTMPRLTGTELAREVLAIRPDLPVVVCTGFSETATLEKVQSLGIRELINKPLGLRKLSEVVRGALDSPKR